MESTSQPLTELKKVEPTPTISAPTTAEPTRDTKATESSQKTPCKKHPNQQRKKKSVTSKSSKPKKRPVNKSEDESSESETSSPSSSSSSSESSESETSSSEQDTRKKAKRRDKKVKAQTQKLQAKLDKLAKMQKNRKKATSSEEDDESDSEDSPDDLKARKRKSKSKSVKKSSRHLQDDDDSSDVIELPGDRLRRPRALRNTTTDFDIDTLSLQPPRRQRFNFDLPLDGTVPIRHDLGLADGLLAKPPKVIKPQKKKRASKVAFKRVDQLWDQSIHQFRLRETVADYSANEWDQYIFTVRRKFDWEHKYTETLVDIKSKPLKECLQHIMAGVKGVSLVQDTPHVNPNTLFLYLEESRAYMEELEREGGIAKKKKARKAAITKAQHLRVLVKYLDKDYAATKKALYPLLENNLITFDLLWALFKPNTIAYTTTYGDIEEPRAFRIDYANKETNFMKGTWYNVEGKYLEYDGKSFGMGNMAVQVPNFQGARRIASLDCYPLQYHKDATALKARLIERGKKFVALEGVHYRYHKGMAYTKRKRQILKININGRIMCDPAIHRRINPNYLVSTVKPKEEQNPNVIDLEAEDEDNDCGCDQDSSDQDGEQHNTPSSSEENLQKRRRFKVVEDPEGKRIVVEVDANEEAEAAAAKKNKLTDAKEGTTHAFTEEELLIASPVVLGFAFSEKLWLEFTISGISDIEFNEDAFDSLVLPENQKSIVKALVSSHAFHPSKSIDDIISGKGRGLCCVLHGPPGTGKTLTAEGIADLLKCPLYMVSAGDLGTDPRNLEKELQNILDIAHSWGAILLLDEADVFLEKRSIHDIHRNALVSIFLRLLEYFQGILFLTTNRVQTFDEAFVSRIHLSLRYEELSAKARLSVWKLFIEKVKTMEGFEIEKIKESDFVDLSRRNVNGRQIKNLVRAAQALAVHEEKPLSMAHIRRVIDVAESFERELKGGTGYTDAMRSYT